MPEQDLAQAWLGPCGSASILVSSGLTEHFTSCYLCCSLKRALLPVAAALSSVLLGAAPRWA